MNTMEFTSAMRAEQYHREQLDDYYQEQNRAICQFGGRLAPQLGLSGEFDPIKFRDALYGKFGNHEWVNRPGEHSNAAIDCHLAPPKSVTLMALVAGDERIVAAHQKAVQTALKSLERLSMTRVSANKETKSEYIGKLAWASFQHETARAVDGTDPDPQLHTHSLIFNAVLCADGKLRTLDAREMLRARLEVDSIYKTELVRYLKSFGYNLVMTEKAFEIDGISQEVIDEFSRRSQQVVGNLKEMGLTRETASGLARQVAALQNRLAKVAGEIYVRALIVAGWKDRAAAIQALQIPNPDIQEQLATEQKIQPAQQEKASEMEIAAAQEAPLSPATPTEKGNNDGNELRPKFYAEQFTDPHPARQTSNLQELSLLNMDALHQRSAMLLPRTASDVVQVKPARNDDIGMRRPIDGDTPTNRGSDVDQFGKNDRDHAARSADERSDGGRRDGDGRNLNADEAIAHALADMTERDSVITSPSALIAGAAHASHYTLSNESLHVALQKAVSRGQVILGDQGKLALVEAIQRGEVAMRPTGKLTTKAIMDAEESYLKAYKNGLESRNPMADSAVIAKEINEVEQKLAARAAARGIKSDGKLTAGQRRFVEAVCTSKDAIVICEGDAGTGKSTAVEAILAISNASGHKTIGLAPTTKAVAALEQSGVPTVTTKSALLSEKFWKEVDEKTLIILDEAGLVPAKDMADLTRRVEERGGQIVPTGDTKQFRSVQSGTPLSQLRAAARELEKDIRLDEMRRGRTAEMRSIHTAVRDKPADSLEKIFENATVHVSSDDLKRYALIAEIYSSIPISERNETLVLTGMNRDRVEINKAIREKIDLDKTDEQNVDTFESKSLTKAKQCEIGSYKAGDLVKFNQGFGTYKKGEIITVMEKTPSKLIVSRADGTQEEFHPNRNKAGENVTIGTRETIQLTKGDLIRFTEGHHVLAIKNGDRGEVLSIDEGKMTVRRADGQAIVLSTDKPLGLRYGYCSTGHSSQGDTAKHVIFHARHDDPTVDKKSWYTNITRSAEKLYLVTDAFAAKKIEKLRNAIGFSKKHETAHDMQGIKIGKQDDTKIQRQHYFGAAKGLQRVSVEMKSNDPTILNALREAHNKYGDKIHIAGMPGFVKRVVELTTHYKEFDSLKFVDSAHNKLKKEMVADRQKAIEKEAAQKTTAQANMQNEGREVKGQSEAQAPSNQTMRKGTLHESLLAKRKEIEEWAIKRVPALAKQPAPAPGSTVPSQRDKERVARTIAAAKPVRAPEPLTPTIKPPQR